MKKWPNPATAHHTITTARRPDNIPLICTGAGPIHPAHGPPKLRATEAMLRNRFHIFATFPPFFPSVWTCAFTWFQTHCDIFLNLLAGEFSSRTVWLMLCCPISVNQYLTIKGRMPISPLSCLKLVNCQHCWQKATNSRLFCSTVAWGRLARVLLALPLLGETPLCTCGNGEHAESTPGTWGPGVEPGWACKGKGGLVEGKAAASGR